MHSSQPYPGPDLPPAGARGHEGALGPYLRAIRSRLAAVALITAAAVGAAAVLVGIRSREFEATTQLLVAPLPSSDTTFLGVQLLRESGDPTRTVQTAVRLIDSAAAAERTARALGPPYDVKTIEEVVTVGSVGESNIVGVTATADSAQLAARIADTFARAALEDRDDKLQLQLASVIASLDGATDVDRRRAVVLRRVAASGDPTLTLSQRAQIPVDPTGAPDWLVLVLALAAGFTLASVAALLMERLGRSVRDSSELLEIAPYPVLARVPSLPRRHDRGSATDLPPAMREAFRMLQIELDQRASGASRSVGVISPSSADGRTTTALNLALALVAAGHEVILMDFDLRKPSIEERLGMPPSSGLMALLTTESRLDDLLRPVPSLAPLRVLSAASGPGDVWLLQVIARQLDDILTQATALADYVVVDTAPLGEGGEALTVAACVDEVIVVGRAGNTDRAAAELTSELLERSGIAPAGWVLIGEDGSPRGAVYSGNAPRRRSRAPD